MKYLIVLAAVFACVLSAEHTPRWVLPRLPLSVLLSGKFHLIDENDPKIVGGKPVEPNSLPFQVSWQRRGTNGNFAVSCGGSILNENVILNAAHCVVNVRPNNYDQYRVVAGEHSILNDTGLEQIRNVADIKYNLNYDANTYENDISLIFLSSPLDLSVPSAAPVKLPPALFDPPAGTIVTVSGWGTTASGGLTSDVLLSVDVPVVADDVCNAKYAVVGDVITESMLCAGDISNGGIDSCQGDSGGPLFTKETDGSFVQHGIVSWGRGCALASFPGVYTQVSYFLDWIEANKQP